MLIDTHAHLTHTQLSSEIDQVIQRAHQAGVCGILCVGTSLEDSQRCIELASRFDLVRSAIGIHPNNCCQADLDDWNGIVELAKHPAVVALGETGLDRYWDDCPWEVQLDFFRRHIELSRKTGLPVVIHTRDCGDEMVEVLRTEFREGPFKAVMHSFTGSSNNARELLDLQMYISFAGMITFKNSGELRKVAQEIPLDRLLVETDSPYLTPHPYRGQRPNRPDLVRYTADCLAELFGIEKEQMADHTTRNAQRLFGCWATPAL